MVGESGGDGLVEEGPLGAEVSEGQGRVDARIGGDVTYSGLVIPVWGESSSGVATGRADPLLIRKRLLTKAAALAVRDTGT